jgi:hypothetical protein
LPTVARNSTALEDIVKPTSGGDRASMRHYILAASHGSRKWPREIWNDHGAAEGPTNGNLRASQLVSKLGGTPGLPGIDLVAVPSPCS